MTVARDCKGKADSRKTTHTSLFAWLLIPDRWKRSNALIDRSPLEYEVRGDCVGASVPCLERFTTDAAPSTTLSIESGVSRTETIFLNLESVCPRSESKSWSSESELSRFVTFVRNCRTVVRNVHRGLCSYLERQTIRVGQRTIPMHPKSISGFGLHLDPHGSIGVRWSMSAPISLQLAPASAGSDGPVQRIITVPVVWAAEHDRSILRRSCHHWPLEHRQRHLWRSGSRHD